MPHAAFVEEYDEDANVALPETRQVANVAAKRSKSELRPAELALDLASDSGYSSRTAATVNSGHQSPPSGRRSPVALKLDTTPKAISTEKHRESRKDKGKERADKRTSADMMQYDAMRNSSRMAPSPRSQSKARRRDSASVRHPSGCWECDQGLYHPSTPMEPRPMDYPPYYYPQPAPPPPPSVHDIPSSPKAARYPYPYSQDVHVSQGAHAQRRMSRSYHDNGRPLSFHGPLPDAMYNSMPMSPYEHGPPPSASAFANLPSYPQPPYPPQHPQYYHDPGPGPQAIYERPRASSKSRPKERSRRGSVYGPPVVEYTPPSSVYDGGAPLERRSSREPRSRPPSQSLELDEDYYRMPPPPPPPVPKPKSKPPLQIIQPRKAPSSSGGGRRPSQSSFDMSDLEAALPDRVIRKISDTREPLIPERSQSLKKSRRMSAYHESERPARIAIENSRRRRVSYYVDSDSDDDDDDDDDDTDTDHDRSDLKNDLEQKHRSAEEYQAARSGSKTVPLTADALFKAKMSQRPESDSGSQKSRSNSSRGSDARTRDGSGVGSKYDDDGSITMTMKGLTMSFTQEALGGKTIHLQTGEEGAMQLNIEGSRRPRRYIMPAQSDYTSVSSRREHEDLRRTRDERRSDRASRRSSRSTFSGRGYD